MTKQKMSATSVILFALSAAYCVLMLVLIFVIPVAQEISKQEFKVMLLSPITFLGIPTFSLLLLHDLPQSLKKCYTPLMCPLFFANVITMILAVLHPDKYFQAFLAFTLPVILLSAIFIYADAKIAKNRRNKRAIKS